MGPIDYPKATAVNILLALTPEACRAYIRDLKPGGTLLIDLSVQEIPPGDFTVHSFPILATAGQVLGNSIVANIVALGFLNRVTGLVSPSAWKAPSWPMFPPRPERYRKKYGFKAPAPSWKARINDDCLGCHLCIGVCPVKATEAERDQQEPLVKDTCINCGHCERHCPTRAIRAAISRRPSKVTESCMFIV